ncbi:DUF3850 domain-containing protein [Paenibacillus phocaensis]|uniref:DUF3850 domain-containing protein n=1 Tax=Paenibacillus phocaensis TaxID=1776378 RepID=UPI000839D5AF|nr:DUF3850 domain-containing protein [Paenibacillus phocaensis]
MAGKVHELKTWPEYFRAVVSPTVRKRKTVEIRKDDRGFEVGDTLRLLEFDPEKSEYTGWEAVVTVSHCLRGQPWVPDDYVALSIILEDVSTG